MSLKRKLAYNTLMQLLAKLGTVIFGTLTIAIMTRYLGQEGFGEYSTIVAYLAFFGVLADFGLQITTVNLMSNPKYDPYTVFKNAFTLRALSAIILFCIAPLILLLFPYSDTIKQGAFILTLNYALLALHQLLIGFFQKELAMERIALAEIIGKIVLLAGVWLAYQADWGLMGMLWVIVISTALQVLISFLATRRFMQFSWAYDMHLWKKILHDSWPIAISIIFNLVYFKADTLVLSLTRSQSEVGIYSAPYRILEILTAYPYLFIGLLFPLISTAWATKDTERFRRYFQHAFDFLVIAAIPLIIGTLPLAEKVMTLLAGKDFAISGIVLQYLIFATAIIFVNVIFSYTIVIIGKQKKLIWGYIATAVVALTGYLIFIPLYSYMAAAIITIIAELMIFAINYIVATRGIGWRPSYIIVLQSLLASGVMFVGIMLTLHLPVLVTIVLAMIVYTIALYLVGGIRKDMLMAILKKSNPVS